MLLNSVPYTSTGDAVASIVAAVRSYAKFCACWMSVVFWATGVTRDGAGTHHGDAGDKEPILPAHRWSAAGREGRLRHKNSLKADS